MRLNRTNLKNIQMAMQQRCSGSDESAMLTLLGQECVLDMGGTMPHVMLDVCPCITRARGGQLGFWSYKRVRRLSIPDLMRLQGVSPGRFSGWQQQASRFQMGGIIGNAIPLNLMERLLRAILNTMGMNCGPDRWAEGSACLR